MCFIRAFKVLHAHIACFLLLTRSTGTIFRCASISDPTISGCSHDFGVLFGFLAVFSAASSESLRKTGSLALNRAEISTLSLQIFYLIN